MDRRGVPSPWPRGWGRSKCKKSAAPGQCDSGSLHGGPVPILSLSPAQNPGFFSFSGPQISCLPATLCCPYLMLHTPA